MGDWNGQDQRMESQSTVPRPQANEVQTVGRGMGFSAHFGISGTGPTLRPLLRGRGMHAFFIMDHLMDHLYN